MDRSVFRPAAASRWLSPARRAARVLVVSLVLVGAVARGGDGAKHVRLLAVGNSFSGNATRYLPDVVKAAGDTLTFRTISIGGCPLQRHWTNALAFQQGATAAHARAWSVLSAEAWDIVTIQQYSFHSFRIETYRPYAKLLHDHIKAQAPAAEVLLHETWAYRADDPLFKPGFTLEDMHRGLRDAYGTIARELGCRVIPVGEAFENARRDGAWGGVFPDPSFDRATARFPALPDQTHSLHMGWTWATGKDGKKQLKYDGHHASAAGQYLGAAVWFEFLFGRSVVGNTFVPKEVGAGDVAILQRIAHETVAAGLRPATMTP